MATETHAQLRQRIWERDGGVCGVCGSPVDFGPKMHIDRIDASIRGYEDHSNLRATHGVCNMKKGHAERRLPVREPKVRVILDLPDELHEKIKRIAARERRSTQGQIVYILERRRTTEAADE